MAPRISWLGWAAALHAIRARDELAGLPGRGAADAVWLGGPRRRRRVRLARNGWNALGSLGIVDARGDLELRRTPVYPLFIAFVVRQVGEDLAALALTQHLLGVATSVVVAALGIRYWGGWTGLLAGLLVALDVPRTPFLSVAIRCACVLGGIALVVFILLQRFIIRGVVLAGLNTGSFGAAVLGLLAEHTYVDCNLAAPGTSARSLREC